ncbi:MAG TPA: hypothetical protein GXX20_02190 [Clostridiaceae bacterium]|nr:hypothetical protein [Clostridiaceae bacterium]
MEQFLISFIYTAVSLAIIMPVFLLAERRILKKLLRVLEEKNAQLLETIKDADEMLDELNRLSDYIAELLDGKKNELIKQKDEYVLPIETEVENEIENEVETGIDIEADEGLSFNQEKQLHKEVYELLEKGMSCEEIARKLNRGKGEVQLIIDMKKYY